MHNSGVCCRSVKKAVPLCSLPHYLAGCQLLPLQLWAYRSLHVHAGQQQKPFGRPCVYK